MRERFISKREMERSRIFSSEKGDENVIVGFVCCTKGLCSFEECLEAAANHPPQCRLTYPILSAMVKSLKREATEITVTGLLNCLRKVVLEKRRTLHISPEELYYTFRGQLFHTLIAANQIPGAVVETRFSRQIGGLTISGQPDVIFPEKQKLVDYKTTRQVPRGMDAYQNHALQVNIYRWLVAPIYHIHELEIVYLDMNTVKRVSVPLMDPRSVVGFIATRARILKRGLDGGHLPGRVGPEGLWQCNGYCPFTRFCWPRGVPRPDELRKKQRAKVIAIRRARGEDHRASSMN